MDKTCLQQLKRGTMEMLFLSLIENHAFYGSEIMAILNEEGAPYFAGTKEGSVYPVFYRLEDEGFIQSIPVGKQKKTFQITEKGRKRLAELEETWSGFVVKVNELMQRGENDRCRWTTL